MATRTPTGPGRRGARERALGLLYEAESKGCSGDELLDTLPVSPDEYAVAIVEGVSGRAEDVDALIGTHAKGWGIRRLPAVDRALLRMAVFELMAHDDVPTAVVLDEAVELAKEYSTEKSGRFINGVLAAVADDVRSG